MFNIGQRWFSEAEPELGLGIIESVEAKTVSINYPSANELRTYGQKTSPLKRYKLEVGEVFTLENGDGFEIEEVFVDNEIIFYSAQGQSFPEMLLDSKIDLNGPKERVITANYDSENFYRLKYQAFLAQRRYEEFEHKGFLGAKIRLIPHQVYVVNQVLKMDSPKVMLCDEVGLGKTIEASLILHSLKKKEIINSALIIVPESLSYQWFVELYRKFHMTFKVANEENEEREIADYQIVSSKLIKEDEELREQILNKKWDMLIVDESHQIDFSGTAFLSSLVKDTNAKTFATLFLSATPEVLGPENLFNALHTLDPQKFTSFDSFKETLEKSKEMSHLIMGLRSGKVSTDQLSNYLSPKEIEGKSPAQIEKIIVDKHGTGRSYFRNSRANLENYSKLFTQRILKSQALKPSGNLNDVTVFQEKLAYLHELTQSIPDKKILIICHAKNVVLNIQKELQALSTVKIASFHSDQSLMERDRQAAFFADPDGARILASTEIGSEGRNFEFAEHIVLFDLPKVPDQLEQRIGRLDRIGQKNDVKIHLPYIAGSFEEILFRWYNEVFNSFESSPNAASQFHKKYQSELELLLQGKSKTSLDDFINDKKVEYQELKKKIESGKDLLVEINSYNDLMAKEIINQIHTFENAPDTKTFLETCFNDIGVNITDLNQDSFYIQPSDNMLVPIYPGLSSEGISLTYDRDYALIRDDLTFMSVEHPIFEGSLDLTLNSTLGNTAFIQQNKLERNIYFEFIVTLRCINEDRHISSLFLPYTPLRILLDIKGNDFTKKYSKKIIDENRESETSPEALIFTKQIPKESITDLFERAQILADEKSLKFIQMACEKAKKHYDSELARIDSLALDYQKESLTKQMKRNRELIMTGIIEAKLEIGAVRLILPES